MADKTRVLIVEDHVALAENLFEFLGERRYVLDFASDGLTALHLAATNEYDVIVLDVMLPGMSGFDICQRLRNDMHCTTPIILMTAKDRIDDKVIGFARGADDYLVKPFDLRELALRIDALHRRQRGSDSTLRAGSVEFDTGTLKVRVGDVPRLELSGTAAHIFEELMRAYPRFVSYDEMHASLWPERDVDINNLRTHIYTLRKLLQDNLGTSLIKTLHGRGYRLIPPGED
jgi:DNA-binding response OmpR family regulator